jgi:hypothetical protein
VKEPPQGSPRSWKGEGALSFLSMTLHPLIPRHRQSPPHTKEPTTIIRASA